MLEQKIKRLVQKSLDKGWTLNLLAGEIGVSRTLLRRMMLEEKNTISAETVEALAQFFGMELTLKGGKVPPRKK